MHLLATSAVSLDDMNEAVDLGQDPADVLVASFAENDLLAVAAGWKRLREQAGGAGAGAAFASAGAVPSLCLTCLRDLKHPLSVDLWVERVACRARVIVIRLLGGVGAWAYGCERLAHVARETGAALAILPGECEASADLMETFSTVDAASRARLLARFREGGALNHAALARELSVLAGGTADIPALEPLPRAGLYHPGRGTEGLSPDDFALPGHPQAPTAALLLYRSILLTDDVAPVDALFYALRERGIACVPIYVSGLKDPESLAIAGPLLQALSPDVILCTTAFACSRDAGGQTLFDRLDIPVFQTIVATTPASAWQDSVRGLTPADLAMHVVLPELDGRLLAGALSFKEVQDPAREFGFSGLMNAPVSDRVGQVARRVGAFLRLRRTGRADRRLLLLMPHYPAVSGRTGYAVGLDVPQSLLALLEDLEEAGYTTGPRPETSRDFLRALERSDVRVSLADYRAWFEALPLPMQDAVLGAWGAPDDDPDVVEGAFSFRALTFGAVSVALPPDRGLEDSRRADYHDPDLVPRHALLAFGMWMQTGLDVHALVHMGAHGVLEWLPGKTVALSARCWPEVVTGAIPVIYPFIVSNPGEAGMAKRRLGALTIGHLPPPLMDAGLSADQQRLERLVDEYAQAEGLDSRRRDRLADLIVESARTTGLLAQAGVDESAAPGEALARIDAWLCDLKDFAIKDGQHVFGRCPETETDPLRITSARQEKEALLAALDGRRVPPGPSGSPARGRRDVLPTGRNLYASDPRTMPTPTAFDLGHRAAGEVVRRYMQDNGEPPRRLVMDLWGSASLRTGGEEIAQGLALMGCRPRWSPDTGRVEGIEVLPPAVLGWPRVDVTFRISGLFRDMFPALLVLLNAAVRAVACREDAPGENPLAEEARTSGVIPLRVFGARPGVYGAGIEDRLASGDWEERSDLGHRYLEAGSYAYDHGDTSGVFRPDAFRERVRSADALVHTLDDPARDLLEGSADVGFVGGFSAAVRALDGLADVIVLDTTKPGCLQARSLGESLSRVVYARAVNPRFIEGQMGCGPRGAQEFAETVDRLAGFAETTDAVAPALLDAVFAAYVLDDRVRNFILEQDPSAALAMAQRFLSARRRGVWPIRRNAVDCELEALADAAREAIEDGRLTPS